jgi:glycine/D-amino acid oxidase-like deaminating enzyme
MPSTSLQTSSYWLSGAAQPRREPLKRHTRADVVVVGAGITGLTTAYLLAAAGRSVVVLERGHLGDAETGHTSAHLTMVTDTRLPALVKAFGSSHAQAVWDAGLAAIGQIEQIVWTHQIDAGLATVDGYLHAPALNGADAADAALDEDLRLARELGFDVEAVEQVPVMGRPGLRFPGQARLHAGKYLRGLAAAVEEEGGRIFEESAVTAFSSDPRGVTANGLTVTCDDVVVATHSPLTGVSSTTSAALFQTKLALYTTYVVAARVGKGVVPDALWWDTADPYRYVRVDPHLDGDVVIAGGQDHKTGQAADTTQCFAALERELARLLPDAHVTHRWSGQVIETPDGVPYIGPTAEHQYVATGFGGNGLTFGTLSGIVISDAVLGRDNPWTDLFAPGRTALTRGLWDYVKENADYPFYKVRDWLVGPDAKTLRAIKRGEGLVVKRQGAKVAAYRDDDGSLTLRSAACTHMGCTVAWNAAERTWDCPCHGSRFSTSGKVIGGPAETPLAELP